MPKYEFVAVDFDGTLCADAFPEVGAPNRAVIDYVKRLAADGSKIILYRRRGCFPLPVEAGRGGHRKGGSRDAGAEQHAWRSGRERQRGGGGLKAPAPPPKNCIRKPPRARCAKTSAKRNPPVKTQLINL